MSSETLKEVSTVYTGAILTVEYWFMTYADWNYTRAEAIDHAETALKSFHKMAEVNKTASTRIASYINGGLTAFGAARTAAYMI